MCRELQLAMNKHIAQWSQVLQQTPPGLMSKVVYGLINLVVRYLALGMVQLKFSEHANPHLVTYPRVT